MGTTYKYILRNGNKAVFRHKEYCIYYRSDYIEHIKGHTLDKNLKLHVMHSMEAAVNMRNDLFKHYGDWFDIYRNGEKIT